MLDLEFRVNAFLILKSFDHIYCLSSALIANEIIFLSFSWCGSQFLLQNHRWIAKISNLIFSYNYTIKALFIINLFNRFWKNVFNANTDSYIVVNVQVLIWKILRCLALYTSGRYRIYNVWKIYWNDGQK